jgi:hypothetical protein
MNHIDRPPFGCNHIDELLCDYVDQTLNAEQKQAFEGHIQTCAACAELVADVTGATSFLERSKMADGVVEAPRELITRILYNTPKEAPLLEKLSPKSWLRRFLSPMLQPRFAMGMAMTILSFSMLGKFVTPVRQLKPADLDPVKVFRSIDEGVHRTWDNAVKYYDNLRLVYEIQTAIADIKGTPEESPKTPAADGNKTENKNQNKNGENK